MSFATHPDCKGRTGAMISMVSGLIMKLLRNQKINWGSSTEAEIVVADDDLSQCMWSGYFIEGQVYTVEELEFRQDNMSAMPVENNGKDSSTKWINHIRV